MIVEAGTGVAIVIAGWCLLGLVCSGLGFGILRLAGGSLRGSEPFRAVWVGMAGAVILAQLWNFLWPLMWPFGVLCAVLSVPGWVVWGRERSKAPAGGWPGVGAIVVTALVLLWAAHRATGFPGHPDAPYHLTSVRWYAEHPLVVGLANLHDRLGYNNTSHLLHAAMENGGFAGRSFHIVNSLMAALLLWRICIAAGRLARGGADVVIEGYHLVLLTPVVGIAASNNMSSPTTDWPGMAAAFVGSAELLRLLVRREAEAGEQRAACCAALLTLSLSATFKLTHLPYAALACMLGLVIAACGRERRTVLARAAVVGACLCIVLVGTWMARSALLSGYFAFPHPASGLPVEWKIAEDQRHVNHLVTIAAARGVLSLVEAPHADWVRPWIRWQLRSVNVGYTVLPLAMAAGAAGLVMFGLVRRGKAPGRMRPAPLLIPLGVATAMWWVMSPQPRMGGFLLWTSAGVMAGWALSVNRRLQGRGVRRVVVVGGVLLGVAPIAAWLAAAAMGRIMLDKSRSPLWVQPGPDAGLHPVPAADVQTFVTRHGTRLLTPVHSAGCWDAPLPWTPFPSAQLEWIPGRGMDAGWRVRPGPLPRPTDEELMRAWAVVTANAEPGDLVYASADAPGPVREAIDAGRLPAGLVLVRETPPASTMEIVADLCGLIGRGSGGAGERVWFIHATGPEGPEVDELATVLYALDSISEVVLNHHGEGISLALRRMFSK